MTYTLGIYKLVIAWARRVTRGNRHHGGEEGIWGAGRLEEEEGSGGGGGGVNLVDGENGCVVRRTVGIMDSALHGSYSSEGAGISVTICFSPNSNAGKVVIATVRYVMRHCSDHSAPSIDLSILPSVMCVNQIVWVGWRLGV